LFEETLLIGEHLEHGARHANSPLWLCLIHRLAGVCCLDIQFTGCFVGLAWPHSPLNGAVRRSTSASSIKNQPSAILGHSVWFHSLPEWPLYCTGRSSAASGCFSERTLLLPGACFLPSCARFFQRHVCHGQAEQRAIRSISTCHC
jgi:hypothetical protein